ncbi:MAG: hypothetical protein EH225_03705, partial [Calditrichaeota bacterium]
MKKLVLANILLLFLLKGLFASDAGSISGFVTDSTNGEGLIGANVFLANELIGIATNDQGYYV